MEYEWYTMRIRYDVGWCLTEFKAKDRDHAVAQIEKEIKKTNSPKNLDPNTPYDKRANRIMEVD